MAILLISIGVGLGVGLTAPRKARGNAPDARQRVTADGSVRSGVGRLDPEGEAAMTEKRIHDLSFKAKPDGIDEFEIQ